MPSHPLAQERHRVIVGARQGWKFSLKETAWILRVVYGGRLVNHASIIHHVRGNCRCLPRSGFAPGASDASGGTSRS